jgi:hypothetical protein
MVQISNDKNTHNYIMLNGPELNGEKLSLHTEVENFIRLPVWNFVIVVVWL